MSLTFQQARDGILVRFKTQWDADSAAVAGSIPPVEWTNLESLTSPIAPWARIKVEHTGGNQATLGEAGNRRFDRVGTVTVSIFVVQGTGTVISDGLAKIALDAFEGKTDASGEVWFRSVRLTELGPDPTNKWHQVDVAADFTYDETK